MFKFEFQKDPLLRRWKVGKNGVKLEARRLIRAREERESLRQNTDNAKQRRTVMIPTENQQVLVGLGVVPPQRLAAGPGGCPVSRSSIP